MDFLSAFQEPGVLISLSISILLYLFPNQGRRAGNWLSHHTGSVFSTIKWILRLKKWKYRKSLLLKSCNPFEVNWQIVRTYSLMLLFAIGITTYILLIAVGPLKGIGEMPIAVQYFIYSPVLILEILWLLQKEYAKDLTKAAGKRVKNQSTSRLQRRSRKKPRAGY